MAFVVAAPRSLAESPPRISCVIRLAPSMASCKVGASVTPVPSRLDAWTCCLSARASICSAAPCTITTRMLNERKRATSRRMLAKFSSVTMPASTAIMNVFSRNWGIYWRIPRRSVSFTTTPISPRLGWSKPAFPQFAWAGTSQSRYILTRSVSGTQIDTGAVGTWRRYQLTDTLHVRSYTEAV